MRIKDRPEYSNKPTPMTASRDEKVRPVVERMSAKNYGAVVVVDEDQNVLGLMTERDLMRRLIAGGLNPDTTTVSEIMTPDVRVAKEDDSLVDWLRIMSNERFRRLPIVDENNRLTSIMTQGDFVSYTWPDLIGQAVTLAKGTMNKNYQIFYIFGGVLAYTVLMVAILGIFT